MNLEDFLKQTDLLSKKEIKKVAFLIYFYTNKKEQEEFTVQNVTQWFTDLSLAKPNKYRLLSNIRNSRDFIKGRNDKTFKLHANVKRELDELYKPFFDDHSTINHMDSILPENLYYDTRQYIESIADQINLSYEKNINDGCAVLMRRLIEILLILSFKNLQIDKSIKHPDGNYKMLKKIISEGKQNNKLDLSRNAKQCLEKFRILGNFSAHRLQYTCKQKYIKEVIPDFRVTVEELLYKSGLIK